MRRDLPFLFLALIYLLCGEVMGMVMGSSGDFTLAPAHAHLNLLGWVSCALFGIVHRLFPAMERHRLAGPQFWMAAIFGALFPGGIAVSILWGDPRLAIAASIGWFVATLLFLIMLASVARSQRNAESNG
ncbi:hypothetical protein [Azospirillum griseum]|uniref:Cytochrome-c oxidase n=1 Tax=Azospirillum griseum TaxID=2496639 RepID=A0A3S0K388_9PROT|nr:hypothetical protein [Azospirillum griseum]RTR18585.1 hypothetical protein EJ903_15200 [Azospirillum griseum]